MEPANIRERFKVESLLFCMSQASWGGSAVRMLLYLRFMMRRNLKSITKCYTKEIIYCCCLFMSMRKLQFMGVCGESEALPASGRSTGSCHQWTPHPLQWVLSGPGSTTSLRFLRESAFSAPRWNSSFTLTIRPSVTVRCCNVLRLNCVDLRAATMLAGPAKEVEVHT